MKLNLLVDEILLILYSCRSNYARVAVILLVAFVEKAT